jgi:hypothetical protein
MMTIASNLREFLDQRGFDCPYDYSRCFYKYNDIGPWVVFHFKPIPGGKHEMSTVIDVSGEMPVFEEFVDPQLEMFLGIDDPDWLQSTEFFLREFKQFFIDNPLGGKPLSIDNQQPYYAFDGKAVIHYEYTTPTKIKVTMSWSDPATPVTIYYEDRKPFNLDDCTGVEVGSIVEGSEVNGTPFYLEFPFDMDEFDRLFDELTSEVSFYWDRDNSHWFCIKKDGDNYANCKECWGDWEWSEDDGRPVPQEVKNAITNMDCCEFEREEDVAIPGFDGWSIVEYYNDMTY